MLEIIKHALTDYSVLGYSNQVKFMKRLKSLDFHLQDNDQPRTCGAVHTIFTGQSLQFFNR